MPLEATMMIIDNSEYMRNGDYPPTRFDAQSDAVNIVFQTKTDANPENSVGIMTMAGKGPEVLVTHTRDLGQILGGLHKASSKISGEADIPTAINVAQLALKHRQNKNLRQRIIVFVGSPLDLSSMDDKNVTKLAKKLKKNNIAIDIVCFGDGVEEASEGSVFKSLVDQATNADNSHLITAPPDPRHLLSEVVLHSKILSSDREEGIPDELLPGGEGSGAGGDNFEFGVDPSIDPELAMAIRMSLEEDQARQAAAEKAAATAGSSGQALETIPEASTSAQASSSSAAAGGSIAAAATDDEEAALLEQALALSQQEDVDMEDHSAEAVKADATSTSQDTTMDEDLSEEEAIARAIAMSMEQDDEQKK